jgi:2-polyprenyl-6-methoxyphenol hydroxylase-like FAD-dependent oxidoreductase
MTYHGFRLDVNWQSTGYVERKLPVNAFELRDQEDLKQDFIQNYNIQGDLAEFVTRSHGIIPKQVFTVDGLISWSKNRVAVIGDAAHGINPNTGYGSSIALEDAVYLASLLNKHGHEDAFYYYETDRKDRVDAIMATLESFNVSYGLEMFDFRNGFDIGMLGESQFDPNYQVKLNE